MTDKSVCMLVAGEYPRNYLSVAKVLNQACFTVNMTLLGHKSQPIQEVISSGIILHRISMDGIFYSPFVSILNPLTTLNMIIHAIQQKAAVYWCQGYGTLAVALILKLFHKKVILDIGDDHPSNFSYVIKQKFRLGFITPLTEHLFRAFENYCIKRANYIISNTESLKKDRLAYNKNIKTICYCPDSSYNNVTPDEKLSEKYKGRDVIVYSGTISFRKAFGEIIAAFEMVKKKNLRALLLLAGEVSQGDEPQIQKVISERSDICLTGVLPYEDMPRYISVGKVGLALIKPANYSYKISVPAKLLEQMACGLPIIAPLGLPEIERIVNESNCGLLVDAENPSAIASAILQLLNDETLRQKMALNAVQYIKKYHSLFKSETIAVFNSVIQSP